MTCDKWDYVLNPSQPSLSRSLSCWRTFGLQRLSGCPLESPRSGYLPLLLGGDTPRLHCFIWAYYSFSYRSYLVSESGHDGQRQRLEVAAYETPKFPAIFLLRLTNQSAHEIEKRRFLPTSKQLYNLDEEDYDAG